MRRVVPKLGLPDWLPGPPSPLCWRGFLFLVFVSSLFRYAHPPHSALEHNLLQMSDRKAKRRHSSVHPHESSEDEASTPGNGTATPNKKSKHQETHTEEDYKYDQWRHFFYVEAPQEWNASSVATTVSNHDDSAHKEDADSVASTSTSHRLSVFLAGGISNCPDWQSEVMRHVGTKCEKLFVLNPRRTSWDTTDVAAAGKQIQWEFDHLRRASAILFWFPEETLCPITLFELGQWSALAAVSGKKIFVGTHPGYKRRLDVEIQLRLVLPSVAVVDNLEALSGQVIAWYREQTPKNGSTGGECSVQ